MKIKVTTVKEIELDITYPYYSRYKNNMYYKVISPESQIKISLCDWDTNISVGSVTSTPFDSDMEVCTPEEFNSVLLFNIEKFKLYAI